MAELTGRFFIRQSGGDKSLAEGLGGAARRGGGNAEGEVKLYTDNPSVTAAPCHLPLHKGGFWLARRRFVTPYKGEAFGWSG